MLVCVALVPAPLPLPCCPCPSVPAPLSLPLCPCPATCYMPPTCSAYCLLYAIPRPTPPIIHHPSPESRGIWESGNQGIWELGTVGLVGAVAAVHACLRSPLSPVYVCMCVSVLVCVCVYVCVCVLVCVYVC
jgi:hypothetical protein